MRMAQDDDDPVALLPARLQPAHHQGRPDPPPLESGHDRHRGEGQGRYRPGPGEDRQVAEEDVADHPARLLGDERHPNIAAFPQGVHEPGLAVLAEGESVDVPDGFVIGGIFRPNGHGCASQGYSICRAVFMATSWPSSRQTTCRLMSMPAAIPAEQTTRPLSTKRRSA